MYIEFRDWEKLFHEGTAVLKTHWGDAEVPQERGICRGSVESPFLFAIAIETALYVLTDDTLLCAASRDAMSKKYDILKLESWPRTQCKPGEGGLLPFPTQYHTGCYPARWRGHSTSRQLTGFPCTPQCAPQTYCNHGRWHV